MYIVQKVQEREEFMKYSIQVNEVQAKERMQGEAASPLRGFASVVFGDSFKVTNIAILQSGDEKLFVSMPRYKTNLKDEGGRDIYKDICNPITKEFRDELYGNILEVFEKVKQKEKGKLIVGENDDIADFTVKVTSFEREESNIRGLARIYLEDNFVVNNVSILQGKEELFVAMPSYKTNQTDENGKAIYQDVCYPVTKEFREKLYGKVMKEYEESREKDVEQIQKEYYSDQSFGKKDRDTPFR